MSVQLRFPNGYIGTVSEGVAAILCTRPGHAIVRPKPDGSLARNTPDELARIKAEAQAKAENLMKGGEL